MDADLDFRPLAVSLRSRPLTAGKLLLPLSLAASVIAACNGDAPIIVTGETSGSTSEGPTMTTMTTTGPGSTSTSSSGGESTGTTSSGGSETSSGDPSTSAGEDFCPEGTLLCVDGDAASCDGRGGYVVVDECAEVCVDGACLLCFPNNNFCDDDGNHAWCAPDGMSAKVIEACDPVQGMVCAIGECTGECSSAFGGEGCDFYPTVTANIVSPKFSFAVAIANKGDVEATLQIDRGGETLLSGTVAPMSVELVKLPWVDELKGDVDGVSARVLGGAYRLRTDRRVAVYQYSSLENTIGEASSRSSDATQLYPRSRWSTSYRVASSNTWRSANAIYHPGFYAVTAAEDQTVVELHPSATGGVVRAGGGVGFDGTGTITLDRGDVLQVLSGGSGPNPVAADLTGTLVSADKAVQVIGGHMCAAIPDNVAGCDHLEAVMPAVTDLLSTSYVTAPLDHLGESLRPQRVRIIAVSDNTQLSYDPPIDGVPETIAVAGDYIEIEATKADFAVYGEPVLIAQYLLGQGFVGGAGDPSMTIANGGNAFEAYDFLVHAPADFESSFVNIITYTDQTVLVDGVVVDGFSPVGESGLSVARVALSNEGSGDHYIEASSAAINVYGYGQYTSYRFGSPYGVELIPW